LKTSVAVYPSGLIGVNDCLREVLTVELAEPWLLHEALKEYVVPENTVLELTVLKPATPG
jgi:hypothetical protein